MDRRRLWGTMTWSRGLFAAFLLSVLWTISEFLAPLTLAPGTFAYTVGRANAVDHWNLYAGPAFNWFAKVVYVVGDATCHQLWYRSLWINGNQMPVCARDASIYLFATFGLVWAIRTRPSAFLSGGIVNAFPPRIRRWANRFGPWRFSVLVVGLAVLPVAVDGGAELLRAWTGYESTNGVRVLTGIPAGLMGGLFLGLMLKSITLVGRETNALRALKRASR